MNLSREIVKDFTVGTTIYYSFDSKPPTADAKKHDVGRHVDGRVDVLVPLRTTNDELRRRRTGDDDERRR